MFRGLREDSEELARLLERVTTRDLRRLVFAVPAGSTWPLPLYELAMLTGEYLSEHLTHAELTVVTPEEQPLELFGTAASEAMALLLETRGIGLRAAQPVAFEDGVLDRRTEAESRGRCRRTPKAGGATPRRDPAGRTRLRPHRRVRPRRRAHRRVRGRRPHAVLDQAGRHRSPGSGRRRRGDRSRRRRAGAADPVQARPARTALHRVRAALLRHEEAGPSLVDTQPLWWPPGKIVGRYLSPFLAEHLGLSASRKQPRRMRYRSRSQSTAPPGPRSDRAWRGGTREASPACRLLALAGDGAAVAGASKASLLHVGCTANWWPPSVMFWRLDPGALVGVLAALGVVPAVLDREEVVRVGDRLGVLVADDDALAVEDAVAERVARRVDVVHARSRRCRGPGQFVFSHGMNAYWIRYGLPSPSMLVVCVW